MTLVSTAAKASSSTGSTILFSSTLAANAASIDTGANGIAGGYSLLEAVMFLRTNEAAPLSTALVRVNNDSSAIYDYESDGASGGTPTAGATSASTSWGVNCPGSTSPVAYFGVVTIWLPLYASTTPLKSGVTINGDENGGTPQVWTRGLGYRSTSAITRMSVVPGGGTLLLAGSALIIYAR